jgi:membrane protein required for colicin V production
MGFNWIDAIILIVFFIFGFTGFAAGLLRSGVQAIAFIIGVVFAGLFYRQLATDISAFISDPVADLATSILAIFIASALVGQLVAAAFRQIYGMLTFGPLDSVGGLLLGLLKAFILVELVAIVAVRYHLGFFSDELRISTIVPFMLRASPILTKVLPPDFHQAVQQFLQQPRPG